MDSASPTRTRTGRRPQPHAGEPTFRNATLADPAENARPVWFLFDWLAGVAPAGARHRRAHHRSATGEAPAP